MKNSMKSVFFLLFILIITMVSTSSLNAQSGKSGRNSGVEKSDDGVAGNGTPDVDDETGIGNIDEESKLSDTKEKTGIAGLSQETLLKRETKRHENQMKQINAMRRKAKDMLKKSEEMEIKELKRHDESVIEIKNN